MKTKQTTIHRSGAKWLPGAMALAATTASSHAATVQITLTGNKISSTSAGGNTLNADLTGDGFNDLTINGSYGPSKARVVVNNNYSFEAAGAVFFWARAGFRTYYAVLNGVVGVATASGYSPKSAVALNPIAFTDTGINGGAVTNAWLEVHAFNTSATGHTVQFTRLIFDDASVTRPAFSSIPGVQPAWTAVPEPSSFALLGLGAAGLIARRRRQAA
jgi:hypothetical protein